MINDSIKSNKLIGMIQPKKTDNSKNAIPQLHSIGCLGKITTFQESDDGRFLIELKGIIRFEVLKEIESNKKYREFEINFKKSLMRRYPYLSSFWIPDYFWLKWYIFE